MFSKPYPYTESIQVDAAGISVKVLNKSLPTEASSDLGNENKEESAESIVAVETSLMKKEKKMRMVSRSVKGGTAKRERENISCNMKGVAENRSEKVYARIWRTIRKMEERI